MPAGTTLPADDTALGGRRQLAERAERAAEADRVSAALGAKLLAGWAMLDVYCPRWG